ncbi:MAG: TetR/AcrR family transcriptional regulator [Gemmatimonadota bacterium]
MQERWLDLGLDTLRDNGTTGLRIDRLARQLGVTKGSFYAHFSSKNDYLTALCEHWRHQAMPMDLDRFSEAPGTLADQLLTLSRYVQRSERARYDFAMREMAKVNGCAAEAVAAVARARLAFSFDVFRRAGFGEDEARARGCLLYGWLLASVLIQGGLSGDVAEVCKVLGDEARI